MNASYLKQAELLNGNDSQTLLGSRSPTTHQRLVTHLYIESFNIPVVCNLGRAAVTQEVKSVLEREFCVPRLISSEVGVERNFVSNFS